MLDCPPCRRFNPLPRIPPRISKTNSLSILSILCVYIYVRIRSIDFVEGLVSRRDGYDPIVLVSSRTIIRIPELLLRNVTAVVLFSRDAYK